MNIALLKKFCLTYAASVAGLWGFAEAFTYFNQNDLRVLMGSSWWIVFYGAPLLVSLSVIGRHSYKIRKLLKEPSKLPEGSLNRLDTGREGEMFDYMLYFREDGEPSGQSVTSSNGKESVMDEESLANVLTKLVQEAHEKNLPYTLVFGDLDRFGYVNNTFGAPIGDKVVRTVEKIIGDCSGRKIFRFRGDQFVITVRGGIKAGKRLAEKCRDLIQRYPWSLVGIELHVSCSFGVAELAANDSARSWLLRSIHGVKLAKRGGSNTVVIAPLAIPKYFSPNISDHLS